ncbi:MAG: YbjN domain-containing protein [Lachnospiraceae bacterium]|nr:YbjN domain-containing protein [Lachnospiraceae bacterium]
MANSAVQLFSAYMESQNLGVQVLDDNENVCRVGFDLENTQIQIFVCFAEDGTDAQFTGIDFVKIPENKVDIIYKVCNTCNDMYRWVKFVWNEEKKYITCQADAAIQLDSCAEECFGIVMRMAKIVDEAYPEFMKAMWS